MGAGGGTLFADENARMSLGTPIGEKGVSRRSLLINESRVPPNFFDERYDYSYASQCTDNKRFGRGSPQAEYFPPCGFDRLGLAVWSGVGNPSLPTVAPAPTTSSSSSSSSASVPAKGQQHELPPMPPSPLPPSMTTTSPACCSTSSSPDSNSNNNNNNSNPQSRTPASDPTVSKALSPAAIAASAPAPPAPPPPRKVVSNTPKKCKNTLEDPEFLDARKGWHVAYHGTDVANLPSILDEGLVPQGGHDRPRHGDLYGEAIYMSPYPEVARAFAGKLEIDSKQRPDVVLQCRVRPGSYQLANEGRTWLVKKPEDVRCHSLLFLRDFVLFSRDSPSSSSS